MKATGIVRRIDALGRVVIPKYLCLILMQLEQRMPAKMVKMLKRKALKARSPCKKVL